MILESLGQLAKQESLLTNPDYEPKAVAWIITVGEQGQFVNITPTHSDDGSGKPKPKVFSIPRRIGRTSAAVADFLVDKSEYVLGAEPDGKRRESELAGRLKLFRDAIAAAELETSLPELGAVRSFLSSTEERQKALERIEEAGYKSNDLFAFEAGSQLVHDIAAVQDYFSRTRRQGAGADEAKVQCLICGTQAEPVEKHPAVKIPGGTTSGVALVSFNSDAFESYGRSRHENAPVCRDCADAYTTALNRLLSDRYPSPIHPGETLPRRSVRLSPDTTAVFWSDQPHKILDYFTQLFAAPRVENIGSLFQSVHKGRASEEASNRFYCLILSGGQGRAVVRSSCTGTVSRVAENLRDYFASIDVGSDQPLPLIMLFRSLVLQGKLDNLTPGLVVDTFLAIVFGGKFPRTLLSSAVGRCRAERRVTRERAAFLRAYLLRNSRQEVSVGLDTKSTSSGYRLGRLMAVLERVQGAAQNNPNKTIVDRYYGAASTRPGTVFPRLVAMAQHHAAKLTGGLQYYFQTRLSEVMDGIAAFPAVLNMEEQGQFALGYYHQRQELFKKSDDRDLNGKGESE